MPRGQKVGFRHTEESKAKIKAAVHESARRGGAWVASARTRALPNGLDAARARLTMYRCAARRTNRIWDLTEAQFIEITGRDCWYCGAPPAQERKRYPGAKFNGIDRIDNSGGYVVENAVACCAVCNRAKHTMTQERFVALAKSIARRH